MSEPKQQGQYCNIKTVLPLEEVLNKIETLWPDCSIVAAPHLVEHGATVDHVHIVVRFPSVRRWSALYKWLHENDGHEYCQPAKSWRRSSRYVLHLDNPEKHDVPRELLCSRNIDEDELAQLMGAQRQPILESLVAAQSLPLSERFQFLVCKRGHSPAEVSSALRCLLDLENWEDKRAYRSTSALPSALVESSNELPDDETFPFSGEGDFYA